MTAPTVGAPGPRLRVSINVGCSGSYGYGVGLGEATVIFQYEEGAELLPIHPSFC